MAFLEKAKHALCQHMLYAAAGHRHAGAESALEQFVSSVICNDIGAQQGREARQLLESGIGMHCSRDEASFFKPETY